MVRAWDGMGYEMDGDGRTTMMIDGRGRTDDDDDNK